MKCLQTVKQVVKNLMEVLNRMVRYFPAENVKGASDRKVQKSPRKLTEVFQVAKASDASCIGDRDSPVRA